MPTEQDGAQRSRLGLSGAQDTVISAARTSTKTLCSVYLSLAFSRILAVTPDASGKHPRRSAEDEQPYPERRPNRWCFRYRIPLLLLIPFEIAVSFFRRRQRPVS